MTERQVSGTGFLASTFASFSWSPAWRERKPNGEPAPAADGVVAARQRDVPTEGEWVGSLSAEDEVSIQARISGYLLRQHYREGQIVKRGDLLFEIDDRPFRAALHEVKARLQKTEMAIRHHKQLPAADEADSQQLDHAIQANLACLAAVEEAQSNLQFTRILSPIDGVAGPASVQAGNLVRADGGALTTVTRIDPIHVHFSVEPEWPTEIRPRMQADGGPFRTDANSANEPPLELVLPSGAVYPRTGRLRLADHRLHGSIGPIHMTGEFPNPQGVLMPGMVVRVRPRLARGNAAPPAQQ